MIFTALFLKAGLLPSSHAALVRINVPNCNNSINVEAWPVLHKVLKPENGRHTINPIDRAENNGRSHARTDKIQRPKLSMPGCLIATKIEIAIVKHESGNAIIGLKIMYGTFSSPTMSNNNPAVTSNPQNTAITIEA